MGNIPKNMQKTKYAKKQVHMFNWGYMKNDN